MYADKITKSIDKAKEETNRRRIKQLAYNKEHNITPKSIEKAIREDSRLLRRRNKVIMDLTTFNHTDQIKKLQREMELAAHNLDFETAAILRDLINEIKKNK